jgi:hypothetical protein
MAKNLVCGLVFLLVIALFVSCGERKTSEREKIDTGMELLGKLEAKMLTAETGYALGSPVELKMEIKNISPEIVNLKFPTNQRYDFFIFKKGDLVWRWSYDKPFEETPVDVELDSGESLAFTEIWDTAKLEEQHPGGEYQVVGVLTTAFPIATNFVEIGLGD